MSDTAIQEPKKGGAAIPLLSNPEKGLRALLFLFSGAIVLLAIVLLVYGRDYYPLGLADRPFSPKHAYLKPSGIIGLRLGIFGFFLFALVYLYPLRKHWAALGRTGKTRNWFDCHVVLGLTAPVVVTFHSAFKLQGFAGTAYWTMLALVASGMIGRYFYAQIPRNISAAEMSLKEMQDLKAALLQQLKLQSALRLPGIEDLFRLPDSSEVQSMSMVKALFRMILLDAARPFRVWALRRRGMRAAGGPVWLGVMRAGNRELENAIALASKEAALSKRILFLSKTQRVFHSWHVIHRPFSISFGIFVLIHVTVVTWFGYF